MKNYRRTVVAFASLALAAVAAPGFAGSADFIANAGLTPAGAKALSLSQIARNELGRHVGPNLEEAIGRALGGIADVDSDSERRIAGYALGG